MTTVETDVPGLAGRTILAVFAHPDDESVACGGTLARLADAGVRVVLLCASRGESGSTSDPSLVSDGDLGRVRAQELRDAAAVLGISDVLIFDHPDGDLRWDHVPELHAEIVAAIHRSRAERVHRITEAAALYQPDARITASQPSSLGGWLPAIVGRIVHEVDPARIILFGSRATGQAREDSDYDLLVVLDKVDDRRGTQLRIRAAIDDLPISKDVLVATADEVDGRRGRPRGVLHWALAEGRLLYQRV